MYWKKKLKRLTRKDFFQVLPKKKKTRKFFRQETFHRKNIFEKKNSKAIFFLKGHRRHCFPIPQIQIVANGNNDNGDDNTNDNNNNDLCSRRLLERRRRRRRSLKNSSGTTRVLEPQEVQRPTLGKRNPAATAATTATVRTGETATAARGVSCTQR